MITGIVSILWTVFLYMAGHWRLLTRWLPKNPIQAVIDEALAEYKAEMVATMKSNMTTALGPPAPPPATPG